MINQIFRSVDSWVMVKILNTEALINREHPVADIMYLMEERFLISTENKSRHRAQHEARLSGSHAGGGRRKSFSQPC